jgi:Flp pilus assembly protein TadG
MQVPQGRRGQALVEFALVLPILMLIFLGIVQFGLLFSSQIGMISAVRDGIRYGETVQTDASNASANATAVRAKLVSSILPNDMAAFDSAQLTTAQVCYTGYQDPNPDTPTFSVELKITVTYRFPLAIPVVSNILDAIDGTSDGAFAIGTSSTSRVENASFTTSNLIPTPICQP